MHQAIKEEVIELKKEIHPETDETIITCACGEEYKTMSTGENMRVEVCSSCHPFYTGTQRQTARGSRVDKFNRKYGRVSSDDTEEAADEQAEAESNVAAEEEADPVEAGKEE